MLTNEEEKFIKKFIADAYIREMDQVQDLLRNCSNKYQFAKTHSMYVKDWESTKLQIKNNYNRGIMFAGMSKEAFSTLIRQCDEIIDKKLTMVQSTFQSRFGESVFNYLGPDGKTKSLFGGLFS